MLIGEYSQNVGDKNRVAIPKKLRIELKNEIVLSRGFNNSLILNDKERWDVIVNELNTKPLLSLTTREIKRFIMGGSFIVEPDNQGRFVIPEQLKDFAGINEQVVFIGVGEWIEIWDYERWIVNLNQLKSNITNLGNQLYE